jgi:ABC-type transporter Mla MlaB component
MFRITTVAESATEVTLKLEGRLMQDWVNDCESHCQQLLEQQRRVRLDCAAVTFVDRHGTNMLRRLAQQHLDIVNCPALIRALLEDHG